MAVAMQSFVSLRNPNPNSYGCVARRPLSRSPFVPFVTLTASRRRDSVLSSFGERALVIPLSSSRRRISSIVPLAASREESKHSDKEVEKEKVEHGIDANESEEEWKKTLEAFKIEAIKMRDISLETYEEYSKKAIVILKQTSEDLKIQADKARHDLSRIAQEISEEGKAYLSSSPEPVKEIVEPFSSPDDLKDISTVRDFHIGIPYGAFLAIGGFVSFMLTGSISAIRFGVVLGTAIFALSLQSLRSWKNGHPSDILLKSQAAIAAIIFIREWRLFFQRYSFLSFLMTLISGAAISFYTYRILTDNHGKVEGSKEHSENN